MTDQNRHAEAHAHMHKRDAQTKKFLPDPILAEKKFRLFNKNTGLMEVRTLSELINKTFRRGQFEYRGTFTGLKDKNGVDIYEGDIFGKREEFRAVVKQEEDGRWVVVFVDKRIPKMSITDRLIRESEIIGNIYENGELLK